MSVSFIIIIIIIWFYNNDYRGNELECGEKVHILLMEYFQELEAPR